MNPAQLAGQLELKPLRSLSRDDLLRILEIRNEESVRRNMYTCHVISEDEHFAWAARAKDDPCTEFFAVIHEGAIIGATTFNALCRAHKRADWGAYLAAEFQGRGLGSALEIRTLDHAFGPLGLEKLNGEVMAFNDNALRVHLRLGFIPEGIRRRHILRDGVWIDVHMIGMTRDEWAARRPGLTTRRAA